MIKMKTMKKTLKYLKQGLQDLELIILVRRNVKIRMNSCFLDLVTQLVFTKTYGSLFLEESSLEVLTKWKCKMLKMVQSLSFPQCQTQSSFIAHACTKKTSMSLMAKNYKAVQEEHLTSRIQSFVFLLRVQ